MALQPLRDDNADILHASLVRLVNNLTQNCEDKSRKVKRIFEWIARNVRYDMECFRQDLVVVEAEVPTTDWWVLAWRHRVATCVGFADLFCRMCGVVDVPCVKIRGYAKGLGYIPGQRFLSANHVWNAVFVEKGWRLVDVCWGSGYVSETSGQYESHVTHHYLFTKPRDFIGDHLPLNETWQLLSRDETVSLNSFTRQPHFRTGYYINAIRSDHEAEAVLETSGDLPIEITLTLSTSTLGLMTYKLQCMETGQSCSTFVSYVWDSREARFGVQLPMTGSYLFTIYGSSSNDSSSQHRSDTCTRSLPLRSIISYTLICKRTSFSIPGSLSHSILWGPTKACQDLSICANNKFSTLLLVDGRRQSCRLSFQYDRSTPLTCEGILRRLGSEKSPVCKGCVKEVETCEDSKGKITFAVKPPGIGVYRLSLFASAKDETNRTQRQCFCNCLVICPAASLQQDYQSGIHRTKGVDNFPSPAVIQRYIAYTNRRARV